MGLFSRRRTYVSSVIYNMAGPAEDRDDFARTAVGQHMVSRTGRAQSVAETLQRAYREGPGIHQMQFFNWCQENFTIGLPAAELTRQAPLDTSEIRKVMPVPDWRGITVDEAFTAAGDFTYWAEQHIIRNYLEHFQTDWVADRNPLTGLLDVTLTDGTFFSIDPLDYNRTSQYAYIYYTDADGAYDLMIYRQGTGLDGLDALMAGAEPGGEFFPYIPLRIKNRSIRNYRHDGIREECRAAYEKATRKDSFDTLLDDLEANPDIEDIDHAYVTWGVPLNTEAAASKRYLYEFFRSLMILHPGNEEKFLSWRSQPDRDPHVQELTVTSDDPRMTGALYRIRLRWAYINESFHSGLGRPDALPGEIWWETGPEYTYTYTYTPPGRDRDEVTRSAMVPSHYLVWQTSAGHYRKLELTGVQHENHVYDGYAVHTDIAAALAESDESEFYVPLQITALNRLSFKDRTQLAKESQLLVLNCYTVVKTRWYQSFLFRIVAVVALVAVAAVIFPGSMGAASGLLGSNVAVGASMGLTGTAAIVAGAAANAFAAMLLTEVVLGASVSLFGERAGVIIGAVISAVTLSIGSILASGGSFGFNMAQALRPENLLRLTQSAGDLYAAWLQSEAAGLAGETAGQAEAAEATLSEIQKRSEELMGYSGVSLDPLVMNGIQDSTPFIAESSDVFLKRTLMTGSDIADLSHSLIEDFARLNLDLDTSFP